MSTIGGLSTSTSSSIRGYGGLASGLDRDSLIEGMTYATKSKITQQQQKQQQLEWKQAAVQNISDMMIAFAGKYTETLTSPTNLLSSLFWGRNQITTMGANSNKVSITGTATGADALTIMGVKQMAQNAKWTSTNKVSSQEMSGKLNIKDEYTTENLKGKTLKFQIDENNSCEIKFDKNYSSLDDVITDINQKLTDAGLSSSIQATKNGDKISFDYSSQPAGVDADTKLSITGTALKDLGFENTELTVGKLEYAEATNSAKFTENLNERIGGKTLSFSYNGKSATITMLSKEELDKYTNDTDKWAAVEKSIQDQLNSAFGKDRIKVTCDGTDISFKTQTPSGGEDKTSIFTLEGGNEGLKDVLGLKDGASNHLNLNAQLKDSGLKGIADITFTGQKTDKDGNVVNDANGNPIGKAQIKINGVDIDVYEDDTVKTLMDRINGSKAGVSMTYQSTADTFTITAKENGASGTIKIEGDDALVKSLFGTNDGEEINTSGQDAIVTVKYAGSDEEVDLIRDTNSFTVDGLTINVKGTFGYKAVTDENGEPIKEADGSIKMERDKSDEAVEVNAQVNVDKIVDTIKTMVDEYNKIIETVNKELTTKPDRDYSPLTSDQRSEMSDSDIELWEAKAKEGLLFGDSDLRSLSSDLRFVLGDMVAMESIGITTSSLYSDNGKITLDETKLRAALETDPEKVEQLFTRNASVDENGRTISAGFGRTLKNVMDKYVKTMGSMETKGILIRKAGSSSSPMSVTDNEIYRQLQEIKKLISTLQTRLESETDRYIQQFSSLETLISQMNSQSSYLSQIGG